MEENVFEKIIKNSYNFDEKYETEEKKCSICGNEIGDFVDEHNIYGNEDCEECFEDAQRSRLW